MKTKDFNDVVSLIECDSYDEKLIEKKLAELLKPLGGLKNFVKPGQKVVIKPNLVIPAKPEKVCTTHPSIIKALAKKIVQLGAEVTICDSPGGPYTSAYLNSVYSSTKMKEVALESNATLNQNFTSKVVEFPEGRMHKTLPLLSTLLDADVIINCAKLKTSTFMGYSGAVKNMFGAIPGLIKVEMHGNFVDQVSFAHYIIDIHEYFGDKLCLHILDGVVGMEGPGPTGGTPKTINRLLASTNPYMLDLAMLKIMNVDPNTMPMVQAELERNFVPEDFKINIVGEDLEQSVKKDFHSVPALVHEGIRKGVPVFFQPLFHKLMTRRPYVKRSQCRGCGKCKAHCPANAITMIPKKKGQYATFDLTKCIRCFCCQELCPYHVVKIKSGILYKIVHSRKKKLKALPNNTPQNNDLDNNENINNNDIS